MTIKMFAPSNILYIFVLFQPNSMPILNYSSSIDANTTVAQIQSLISGKGARRIMMDYESGKPSALTFEILCNQMPLQFKLTANWRGVKKAIDKSGVRAAKYKTDTHAINVSWRIIKDWIEAQLALIEVEQADLATIFLPYAITQDGSTLSENLLTKKAGEKIFLLS